jgi:hypothetical protein
MEATHMTGYKVTILASGINKEFLNASAAERWAEIDKGLGKSSYKVETIEGPTPFCSGNPTIEACRKAGYCRREISCDN